ncbi:MAG: hypothetical protein KJ065_07940 [Anaerolineae bacterium]|nr:hypothetical protein [Anaerolineae bacterium]
MDDITTLCLLAVFVLVGFALMSRMLGRMGGGNTGTGGYPQRGPNRPMVDDPDIESGGGMGRPAQPNRTNFPGRRGGGLFPSSGGSSQSGDSSGFPGRKRSGLFPSSGASSPSQSAPDNRPSNDDPDIESRGGFGRPKK